jgi:hypothetical protein
VCRYLSTSRSIIASELGQSGRAAFPLDASQLDKLFRDGRAVLYLDGLDEVFDLQTRGSILEEIASFSAFYPSASVIVTSRIIGYDSARLRGAGFAHATLDEFDNPQIANFINRWHAAAEEDSSERERLVGQMKRALFESGAIRALASNPLLLTMMCILNKTQDLPRDRAELYKEASRVLLHDWDLSRSLPVEKFARQEKEELLRELAGFMQSRPGGLAGNLIERGQLVRFIASFLGSRGILESYQRALELMDQLTDRSFILCYVGANRYSFVHRAFLEFYCASWFVECFERKQELSLDELKRETFGAHWQDVAWHEVLRLIAGMVGVRQAQQLVEYVKDLEVPRLRLTRLVLAARCLGEVRNRRAIESTSDALWVALTEVVGRPWRTYFHDSVGHLLKETTTRADAIRVIVGVWPSGRTQKWLADLAERDRQSSVRIQAMRLFIRQWNHEEMTKLWIQQRIKAEGSGAVRCAAIQELSSNWKGDSAVYITLMDRAREDPYPTARVRALEALAQYWSDEPKVWQVLVDAAVGDVAVTVSETATRLLAQHIQEVYNVLPFLIRRVSSDPRANVRRAAVHAVARCGGNSGHVITWLKGLVLSGIAGRLQRSIPEIADPVEDVLWGNESAFHGANWPAREAAVVELAAHLAESPELRLIFRQVVECDHSVLVRRAAFRALADLLHREPETWNMLQETVLSNDSEILRRAAIEAAARYWRDSPATVDLLKRHARCDESGEVRQAAIRGLVAVACTDEEAFKLLCQRVKRDQDPEVRRAAFRALAIGWRDRPELITGSATRR